MEIKKKQREKEEKDLIVFLNQTKDGKYVPIEKSLLPYGRVKEERENIEVEEEYYYSIG